MKWTAERRELARELASKHGQRKAAGMLGCSRAALRRALGGLASPADVEDEDDAPTVRRMPVAKPAAVESEVVGRILAVPDVHAPYHHEQAWRAMVAAARRYSPTHIVILGDLLDCFTVSDHERTVTRSMSLKDEFSVAGGLLDELDALGAAHKWFLQGNHEHRLDRYIANRAPEMAGLVSIQESLRLAERGWTWVPYRRDVRIGKVYFCHDSGFSGVNAVRQTRARYEGNVVLGHVHRAATHYEGDARGQAHFGLCPGWLGDPDALAVDYAHSIQKRREWMHGFAVGELLADDTVHMRVVPIVNGTCVLNGEVVRG